MDRIRIKGGRTLKGKVAVSGAKNAALPILFSTLLTEKECVYERVPRLQDIRSTMALLSHHGTRIESDLDSGTIRACTPELNSPEAPYDLVRKMRASVIVLGPLLARFGEAKVSLPGGCAIGARPINFHLEGLKTLGASIELEGGYVLGSAKRLVGDRVDLPFPSVGATQNILMAATLAQGETEINHAAQEPEIVDLARALQTMGAEIEGAGTHRIRVQGKDSLGGCHHRILGDRIEAGTFLVAGLMTQGDVTVTDIEPDTLRSVIDLLRGTGADIETGNDWIRARATSARPRSIDFKTEPYPGFPTDMQAQLMALMTIADGESIITETIFENRFMHVPELARLGADIWFKDRSVLVRGKESLKGAPLMATDLRASASLILGGLRAEGTTEVSRIYHLDRGYEGMEEKLRSLGADIERLQGETHE